MAVTSVGSADQVAIVATEHTLDTETAAGVYVLVVDAANMVNGDVLRLRIKTKAQAGESSRLLYEGIYANAQGTPNKNSPPVPTDTEIVCTLEQVQGAAGRTFPWNLLKL